MVTLYFWSSGPWLSHKDLRLPLPKSAIWVAGLWLWLLPTNGLSSALSSLPLPPGSIMHLILLFPTVSHVQML